MAEMLSFAQNREDIYINWLLKGKEVGFYVDVGANDPMADSVTKFFYDKGWRGINIEPIKHHYCSLVEQRPRDINLQVGVANKKGSLVFREFVGADGLSTLAPLMQKEQRIGREDAKDYKIRVVPLREILEDNMPDEIGIDFLKIDVEGFEYEVLKSNDWTKYRPNLVVVEANHIKQDWHQILKDANYKQVFFDGVNEYYAEKDFDEDEARDNYPEYVIGPTVLDIKLQEYGEWRERVGHERGVAAQLEKTTAVTRDYETRLKGLNYRLQELENISTKTFVKKKMISLHVKIRRKLLWLQAERNPKGSGVVLGEGGGDKIETTPEVLTELKHQDVHLFLPSIKGKRSIGWRKIIFGGALAIYDRSVLGAKVLYRAVRR